MRPFPTEPAEPFGTEIPPRHVAVVGAGTMGRGIAHVCGAAGLQCTLYDSSRGAADGALDAIAATLERAIARGRVSPDERDQTLDRISTAPTLEEALGAADLMVEAVPEQLESKLEVFRAADAAAPPSAVLASNTSSLSISSIAAATRRPERVIGLHFFNPVHVMRLLEVVRGTSTSESVVRTALAFARAICKEPIVVTDTPGFASSRLGIVLGLEAMRMVEQEVAAPADIDRAMELGYNHPMGPLRLTDLVGLDVRLEIAEYLHQTLGGDQYRPPEILRRMVREGMLGQKSGRGFYDWSGE